MWDFWDEMKRFQEEMDRVFEEFFPRRRVGRRLLPVKEERAPMLRKAYYDLQETDKDIIVTLELPGMEKRDIDVNVTEDFVEVKAERKEEIKKEEKGHYAYARRYAGFYNRIPLPKSVMPEDAKATYKNGILEITLPKSEKSKGRTIKID